MIMRHYYTSAAIVVDIVRLTPCPGSSTAVFTSSYTIVPGPEPDRSIHVSGVVEKRDVIDNGTLDELCHVDRLAVQPC